MDKYKLGCSSCGPLFITLAWLGIIMYLYIPNMGGMGLALPQNIFSWVMMALLIFIIWLPTLVRQRPILITPAAKIFVMGTLVLVIPLFYTRPEWRDMALWCWAGLLGGWGFYFAWLQVRMTRGQRQGVLLIVLLAVSGQAALALAQLFAPELAWVPMKGGRVYGIFQQPNVLASFMATGLALALMLFLLPGFALARARYEHCRQALLGMLLLVSVATVVLMLFALQGGMTLTRAERAGLMDMREVQTMPAPARWVHQERVQFDEQVNALLTYNRTRDESLLEGYTQWAQGYLMRHVDANVYASLLLILRHQGQGVSAEQRRREAALLFPQDPRFQTEG